MASHSTVPSSSSALLSPTSGVGGGVGGGASVSPRVAPSPTSPSPVSPSPSSPSPSPSSSSSFAPSPISSSSSSSSSASSSSVSDKSSSPENHDHLNLATNAAVVQMLLKTGENTPRIEKILFSDYVIKINRREKEQSRVMLITSKACYNLLPTSLGRCKRRIAIRLVHSLTLSHVSDEFVLHVPDEYDYRFKSASKDTIADIIARMHRELREAEHSALAATSAPPPRQVKRLPKLTVQYVSEPDLREITFTKQMARMQSREDTLRRKKELASERHDSDSEDTKESGASRIMNSIQRPPVTLAHMNSASSSSASSTFSSSSSFSTSSGSVMHHPHPVTPNASMSTVTRSPLAVAATGASASSSSSSVPPISGSTHAPGDAHVVTPSTLFVKPAQSSASVAPAPVAAVAPSSATSATSSATSSSSSAAISSSAAAQSTSSSSPFSADPFSDVHDQVRLDDFELLKVLGRGSFGKVMLVRMKTTGHKYAMKILKKQAIISRNQVEHTKAERKILESLQHPFLMTMRYAFQSKEKLYFVLDYYQGGELFFHLKKERRFTEQAAKVIVIEVGLALGHLHSMGIVYRDLKPENILLDDYGHVCLTDFGLSKGMEPEDMAHTFCGTPEYLAPEIVTGRGHNKEVDWWSLGILLYELTVGIPPFYSQNVNEMYKKIQFGVLRFPPFLTEECKSIIVGLLHRDPTKRLGSQRDVIDVVTHPFFADLDIDALLRKERPAPYRPIISESEDANNFDTTFTNEPAVDSVANPPSELSRTVQEAADQFKDFSFSRD